MPSMQKLQLIGHLGGDPEVRYTSGGTAVANFSVATTESMTAPHGSERLPRK